MIYRLKYKKTQEGRFLSHLDLLRTMQRTFRRAGLPLAYSEGFNPHPKISFGSALAVGVTSDGEYLDFELRREMPVAEIVSRLEAAMPPALEVLALRELTGRQDSLMAEINMARYRVEIPLEGTIGRGDAEQMAELLLGEDRILIEREGKKGLRTVDIRPGIYDFKAEAEAGLLILFMDLQTGSSGNVRPEEVAEWLRRSVLEPRGLAVRGNIKIHRLGLFVRENEKIRTPLDF